MKYQKLLIMLCMAMGLTATEAVARQCYTLDECREKALTNNVKIKNSRNGMEMAEQTKKEAFTGYFPNINAGGLGFIADKGLLELDMMGNRLSIADDGLAGGVSASMPLFTGGRIVNANKLASLAVEVE